MKIESSNSLNPSNRIEKTQNSITNKSNNNIKDKIYISDSAKAFEAAIKKAKIAQTDKKEKINKIKREMKSNQYEIKKDKLADKIIEISKNLDVKKNEK